MRKALRDTGPIETSAGKVMLRMSIGIHRGTFLFFLVGESHRELVITGPAATETASMEGMASAGEILVSSAMAELLPDAVIGRPKGEGFLLRSAPAARSLDVRAPELTLEGTIFSPASHKRSASTSSRVTMSRSIGSRPSRSVISMASTAWYPILGRTSLPMGSTSW